MILEKIAGAGYPCTLASLLHRSQVTLLNTGSTSDTVEGRIVLQVPAGEVESGSIADVQDFWHTTERDFFHEEQFKGI